VVKHSPHHPKVQGLSPTAAAGTKSGKEDANPLTIMMIQKLMKIENNIVCRHLKLVKQQ
jgi:hypothetical protein